MARIVRIELVLKMRDGTLREFARGGNVRFEGGFVHVTDEQGVTRSYWGGDVAEVVQTPSRETR